VDSFVKFIAGALLGSCGVLGLIVVLAIIGPLVGYLSGSIFGWMMPQSSSALLQWLGVPAWAHVGHVGAGLAFVGVFFRVSRSTKE